MRVLVVGAGPAGAATIRQLRKNPQIEISTVDASDEPYAVKHGVIDRVDYSESLTPLNLDHVVAQAKPDLVLWTLATEDLALGPTPGAEVLGQALRGEIAAIAEVPVIHVARDAS